MTNLLQIKRSLTNSNPTGLANGELAFTANGDVLFIGSPNGSVIPIGGLRVPGALTSNQALVANTTSGIDKIIVANLVPTQIWANNSFGNNGQLLTSNGTSIYWQTLPPGVAGANTNIQFNDNGVLAGNSNFTFEKDTITLNVGSSTINSTSFNGTANNSLNLGGISASGYQTTAGLSANVATLTANNSTNLGGQPATFYTNATNLASGTVSTARLGSGTANANTFLSGDQSYKTAVTSVASGDGLTGGPIATTGTLSVQAGDGIISNSTGTYVKAGTGVVVNSTGVSIGQAVAPSDSVSFANLTVTGNTALGNNTADDVVSFVSKVNTNIIPSANVTQNLGNTDNSWGYVYAGNVHSVFGYFTGTVEIGGNLVVTGNVITQNVSSLIVQDPLILLAGNNTVSDLVDIGFVGQYYDGSDIRHAGVVRHAPDEKFYVFTNYLPDAATNNSIDTSDASFRLAVLNAYLQTSGLSSNSTTLAIVANSTVNVAISANSLTLSTALAGNSGGTGYKTITNNAILVGNSSNGFAQLALGNAGYVLQSNGTALIYDTLDGGTF
jgi:hypothetical protein